MSYDVVNDGSFGHTVLGTLLGTLAAFFHLVPSENGRKPRKATVFQTAAFAKFARKIASISQ